MFDTFDLALTLTGTRWIRFRHGKGKSSATHFLPILAARLGNDITISGIGSGAISQDIGIGNRTININAHYALQIDGEPILRDCIISKFRFRDLVSSEPRSSSSDNEERWSSKYLVHLELFIPCHQVDVGYSWKPSITTTCRRNDSIGFTVGNALRDIISVRFISVRFPDGLNNFNFMINLKLKTTARRLQVQVTSDIPSQIATSPHLSHLVMTR